MKRLLRRFGLLTDQQVKDDWSGVVKADASRRLPFGDETVDKIYSSHFLEHIPYAKGLHVLKECRRVLLKGGTMRLVVPDLLWHAERYVSQTRKLLSEGTEPNDRRFHDEFLESVYGAYLNKRRYGAMHCYMYDFPTLVNILQSLGFSRVQTYPFQKGGDAELAALDSRPEDSLHVEVVRT